MLRETRVGLQHPDPHNRSARAITNGRQDSLRRVRPYSERACRSLSSEDSSGQAVPGSTGCRNRFPKDASRKNASECDAMLAWRRRSPRLPRLALAELRNREYGDDATCPFPRPCKCEMRETGTASANLAPHSGFFDQVLQAVSTP